MLRAFAVVCVVAWSTVAFGQSAGDGVGEIHRWVEPEGAEAHRTVTDPGWWQRTFVGWDSNGDGRFTGGERGILPLAWDGIMGLFKDLGSVVWSVVWSAIPAGWQADASSLAGYVAIGNAWLPLDFMLGLFFSYYTFVGVFIVCKMTLKFIPFIG